MNVLETTIAHLGSKLSVGVSSDVPSSRPDSFVTVERSGGSKTKVDDNADLTVQVWDTDRLALEALAEQVEDALLSMPDEVVGVFSVEVSKSYYPLQVGGFHPRYVVSCNVYCRK